MSSPPRLSLYEQPLNERMRAFLRLEYLFKRLSAQLDAEGVWSSRGALETLIDVNSLVGRADLKTELIKELERHATTLEALQSDPRVDAERLGDILGRLRGFLATLRAAENPPGYELRQNELVNAVRQRISIPAGTCDFDLPVFHFWLQSPPAQRLEDLSQWASSFDLVRDAIALCLTLVRESATASQELASAGFFQKTLDTGGTPCQMVRVALPTDSPWYPEISAGRHRFTVRFMRLPDPAIRPSQTEQDVTFDLLCCII